MKDLTAQPWITFTTPNKAEKKRYHRYTKIKRLRRAKNFLLFTNAVLVAALIVEILF